MSNIKTELKNLINEALLPETQDYLEELHNLLENNTANEDDKEAIRELESFLVELQNILEAIETEQIDDEQSQEIYEKMMDMIQNHEH